MPTWRGSSWPVRPGRVLRGANLFRAQLQGAHLFNIDLRGVDLHKADLSGANLNAARLQDANLLGINLSRLERMDWGIHVVQEAEATQAQRSGNHDEALAKFEEAEDVYRALRQACDGAGRSDEAGHFFAREMTMRRNELPRWSAARAWSKFVDLLCSYGESPPRIIGASILLNLVCAVFYFAVGIKGSDGRLVFDAQADEATNLMTYLNCVYYSIITFTTLGYGDITPDGIARPIAGDGSTVPGS